jgi:hypothetical protein
MSDTTSAAERHPFKHLGVQFMVFYSAPGGGLGSGSYSGFFHDDRFGGGKCELTIGDYAVRISARIDEPLRIGSPAPHRQQWCGHCPEDFR